MRTIFNKDSMLSLKLKNTILMFSNCYYLIAKLKVMID